ncbi:MAG: hypothetical protein E7305_03770 [Butyrivibrio sp.]|nr:hypothetical protein [Butyrivibrio sp.]
MSAFLVACQVENDQFAGDTLSIPEDTSFNEQVAKTDEPSEVLTDNSSTEDDMNDALKPDHPFGAGVFSWDHLADEEDVECLVKNNITEIYQYIKPEYSDEEIVSFLERMSDKGIDVYILDGEPTWSYKENLRYAEAVIDRIAYINNYVSRRDRIIGVVYDIEPYVLDKWHSSPQLIMDEYAENMKALKDKIERRSYNIEMCVCVPYSFDLMGYEEHLYSLIDSADQVLVLNYNKANEIEDIRTEMQMAGDLGKRIITVYELQPGLLSQTNNSVTYYKDGLGAIKISYENMLNAYEERKLGIAYHTLEYLKVLSSK